jgi:hypothetical protein
MSVTTNPVGSGPPAETVVEVEPFTVVGQVVATGAAVVGGVVVDVDADSLF